MKTAPLPQGDAFRLAAQGSGTPIAQVSFIDLRRRRHKGHVGVDAAETPIENALYTHAILQRDGTVESDVPQYKEPEALDCSHRIEEASERCRQFERDFEAVCSLFQAALIKETSCDS